MMALVQHEVYPEDFDVRWPFLGVLRHRNSSAALGAGLAIAVAKVADPRS